MVGPQISQGQGKRTARRVLATEPQLRVEVSAEEISTLLGIQGVNLITYTATIKPDGTLHGEGEGAFATPDGQTVTWKGLGVGRFGEAGAVYYCGSLSYTTTSPQFARLNGLAGIFQFEVDAQGNTRSTAFEMAPAGAAQSAGA